MGKPYASEIAKLDSTLTWAADMDVASLAHALRTAGSMPLIAIGSGGSLTAAHLLSLLHRHFSGHVSAVMTPFDIKTAKLGSDSSVWFISAGGTNRDIIEGFRSAVHREPRQIGVLCANPDSPLAAEAARFRYVDFFSYALPSGKDGFLATNSLAAFSLLIARAYANIFNAPWDPRLPVDDVFAGGVGKNQQLAALQEKAQPLWGRQTLLVLHGNATRIGAIDLESKFTEAALGHVQMADYRNFAHGRHHWLAKRGDCSAVLAFTTPEDRTLAERTLVLIPREIPTLRVDFAGDLVQASIASLFVSLHATSWAGNARGIDPGRPGVPMFGERLYHLRMSGLLSGTKIIRMSRAEQAAIERKAGVPVDRLAAQGSLLRWRKALATFRRSLASMVFSSVAFDYDGTLVDSRHRREPPIPEVVEELIGLLKAGMVVGIATGRGKSVRKALAQCIPHRYHDRVVVGYYNGAEVALLSDADHPDGTKAPGRALAAVAEALRRDPELVEIANQEDRPSQITLEPRTSIPEGRLWHAASEIVRRIGAEGVTVVRSSHSVDVLAPGISKLKLIEGLRDMCGARAGILKIGDRGRWPGNDFDMLSSPCSLSVDEGSTDPSTCWNLAPRGHRGVQATLGYLRALRIDGGKGRLLI